MTPNVNCVVADLPAAIPAFVISDVDGVYTIVLNAHHTYERHLKAYHHEMKHIENGDYDKKNIDIIEIYAHGLK